MPRTIRKPSMMSQLNFSSSTMRILPGEFCDKAISSSCYCEKFYIVMIFWRLGHVPCIDRFGARTSAWLLGKDLEPLWPFVPELLIVGGRMSLAGFELSPRCYY